MKRMLMIIFCAVLLMSAFPVSAAAAVTSSNLQVGSVTVSFTETGDGSYKVSWKIAKALGMMYVRVYLSVSDHDYEAQNVELGSIRSGSEGSLAVTIPDVDSGYYHFMIGVTSMNGTVTYAFSDEAVFFDNKNGAAPLSDITIGRNTDTVYAVWQDETPAVLYVYDAKTKELLASEHGYDKPLSVKIPSGHTDITAGAAAYEGSGGRFIPVECPAAGLPDPSGVFPEEDITNQPEYVISAPKESSRIFLNGRECKEENGSCVLELEEGENDLLVFVTDPSGAAAAQEKTMVLDTVAPELTVENPGSAVTTAKKTVFIQGYAEKDTLVTCQNEAVGMVGDCFSIKKDLSVGANRFELSAVDKAGNSTVVTIEVQRTFLSETIKTVIIIVILSIAGILAEGYLLIYRKRRRKKHD